MKTVTLIGNEGGEAVTFCNCCIEIGFESRFCRSSSTGSTGAPSNHKLLKIKKSWPAKLVNFVYEIP